VIAQYCNEQTFCPHIRRPRANLSQRIALPIASRSSSERAANERDELAALHSITSSAG
jgi:hypothetical protein